MTIFAIVLAAFITTIWLSRRMMLRARDAGNSHWWLGFFVYVSYARGWELSAFMARIGVGMIALFLAGYV
jgi:hypothetical protein